MDRTTHPLAGQCVVVTRAPEQATELVAALERLGAEVLLMPTVEFLLPEDSSALDAAIARLREERPPAETPPRQESAGAPISISEPKLRPLKKQMKNAEPNSGNRAEFDWILFTSQNAVRFFAKRLKARLGADASIGKVRTAAIGPATAEAAAREGFRVDYVATNHTGEALARELANELRGRRVLLPRGDRADDRLPAALREAGAEVTEVVAYRTAAPKEIDPQVLERVRKAQVDAVIFASPSAFHNLSTWIPTGELAALAQRVQFAAIGPTTARALREAGARVEIEAADASAAALADAIAGYYQRQPTAARHT